MVTIKKEAPLDVSAELDQFEYLVCHKAHQDAYKKLYSLLKSSSIHRNSEERIFERLNLEQRKHVATRFAAATFQLFMDEGFSLSQSGYESLSMYARNLAVIISLTHYRNADHVIRHLVGQSSVPIKKDNIDLGDFRKVLLLWSPFSDVILPFERFAHEHPELMKYLVFNALSYNCYVDKKVSDRRDMLLALLSKPDYPLTIDTVTAPIACSVWMYATYSDNIDKHNAKDVINRAYKKWMLEEKGVKEPSLPAKRSLKEKPRLVVVVELLTSNHAVCRCFGKALLSIREKFHTIGLAIKDYVDDEAMKVFDEVVYIGKSVDTDIKKNVGKIIKAKPDVLLYLSLGMHNITVPMATLRLAPIQIMFPAHPATSHSENIDYFITEDMCGPSDERNDLSEKLVLVPTGSFQYTDKVDMQHEEMFPKLSDNDGQNKTIRIALPAFSMKLTGRFIELLREIKNKAKHNIEYHFFPHLAENPYIQFKETVDALLPGSEIHLTYGYRTYLKTVGQCDLYMSSFPFSNYNGSADSIKVNLPMIIYDSGGLECRGEVNLLRICNFPEWTIAKSEEEYLNLAVEMVDNETKRKELAEFVSNVDVAACFEKVSHSKKLVGETIAAIYQQHETLIESTEKTLYAKDIVDGEVVSKVANDTEEKSTV